MTPPPDAARLVGEHDAALDVVVQSVPIVSPRRPAPAPDRPRHLHSVPGGPAPGRRPPSKVFLAGTFLAGALVLVLVSMNVMIGQSGFGETDLVRANAEKQQSVEMLRVDVLRLSAPSRIHQRAQQLGLVPAGELTYLAPSSPGASAPAGKTSAASTTQRPMSPSRGRGGR